MKLQWYLNNFKSIPVVILESFWSICKQIQNNLTRLMCQKLFAQFCLHRWESWHQSHFCFVSIHWTVLQILKPWLKFEKLIKVDLETKILHSEISLFGIFNFFSFVFTPWIDSKSKPISLFEVLYSNNLALLINNQYSYIFKQFSKSYFVLGILENLVKFVDFH